MKHSTILRLCSLLLTAAFTATATHHFTVRDMLARGISHPDPAPALKPENPPATLAATTATPPPTAPAPQTIPPTPPQADLSAQRELYDEVLAELRSLKMENRNLLDQIGETNRDLMKLEFRVDTHSESFRPLPASDSRFDSSFDDGLGVLPPRAEPYHLPE
jgi:hypothetical protein